MTEPIINPIDQYVGSRIRTLRVSRNLRVSQLASLIGVTERQLQAFEAGSTRVGAETLSQIASALNEHAIFFFDGAPNFRDVRVNDDDLLRFGRADETRELVRAFVQIEDAEARRKIIDLAVCFAAVPKAE